MSIIVTARRKPSFHPIKALEVAVPLSDTRVRRKKDSFLATSGPEGDYFEIDISDAALRSSRVREWLEEAAAFGSSTARALHVRAQLWKAPRTPPRGADRPDTLRVHIPGPVQVYCDVESLQGTALDVAAPVVRPEAAGPVHARVAMRTDSGTPLHHHIRAWHSYVTPLRGEISLLLDLRVK